MPFKMHPLIPEAQDLLRQGRMSRRDFIRVATLLGATAGASAMAACGPAATPAPATPPLRPRLPDCRAPADRGPQAVHPPWRHPDQRGRVDRADHPARFSLVSQSHPWRHVFDYLTYTDPKGITTPYLLDKWQASDDLKTWTLMLKQGIKFNNGQELTCG